MQKTRLRRQNRTRQTWYVNRTGVRPSPIFLIILAVTVAGGVLVTVASQTAVNAGTFMLVLGGWGTSLCLHEFSHAIVAYRGGDYAVRSKGYLTLDIRRYTDPVFSIVLPLLLLAVGGIPLPGGAVWINHSALRDRKVESFVSLAGPLSNLVLGVALIWADRTFVPLNPFTEFGATALSFGLMYLAMLQIFAFVINILPIPGLDGWGAIEPWLSPEARRFGQTVRPWAPLVLFAILIGIASANQAVFNGVFHIMSWLGGDPNEAIFGQANFLFWRH
jgi:Zn-dependent protease